MKNGVSAGMVAPLYSTTLVDCRVNDMLSVDQYLKTSWTTFQRNLISLDDRECYYLYK